MVSRSRAVLTAILVTGALAFAESAAAQGFVPPWLQGGAEVAITLTGVNSAQAIRSGETTNWLVLRGPRPCPESDALWAELEAASNVNALAGWCWSLTAPASKRIQPTDNVSNLLTWKYTIDPGQNLDQRPALILAQAARGLEGTVDAEAWLMAANPDPRVLAMYRTGECPPDLPTQDQWMQDVDSLASVAGLEVTLSTRTCYVNLVGPLYRQMGQAGGASVHLRQVIRK